MHYRWNLSDLKKVRKNNYKVFSCFSAGGGSSMGYKLSGYEVLGFVEIDERMAETYQKNLQVKFPFVESIRDFLKRETLPEELFSLDILDGSPPCSSFSQLGNREKDWGKEKQYSEGQAKQVLDTLFFDFIQLAERLKPKVVIAENVKGLLEGKAFFYAQRIIREFNRAGYVANIHIVNAADTGVPQLRERVIFTAIRNDLTKNISFRDLFRQDPIINLKFKEPWVSYSQIQTEENDRPISKTTKELLEHVEEGDTDLRHACHRSRGKQSFFAYKLLKSTNPLFTIAGNCRQIVPDRSRHLNTKEIILGGSFPQDYQFTGSNIVKVVGMSVPPLMMARISKAVQEQWLDKI